MLRVLRFRSTSVRWLRNMSLLSMEPKEVSFPVPWGHVAGKAWGDPLHGKPVLALHGWLDNAGSFDTLIPLLSDKLYVVAVDFPGHGLSSHRPLGSRYHAFEYLADIQYVVDALKWDKFSFLAHSMGGGAASWYAGAVPERVECMVLLEALGFWSQDLETLPKLTGKALENVAKFDKPDNKSYSSLDAVLERIVEGHIQMDKFFDRNCASILAKRGTRQLEDGSYQFTRDMHVKSASIVRFPHEVNEEYVGSITCPVVVALGEGTGLLSKLRHSLKNDQIQVVQASDGHHLHLHHPEAVQQLVSTFLLYQTIPSQFEGSKL